MNSQARRRLLWLLIACLAITIAVLMIWKTPAMSETTRARSADPDLPRFTELPAFDPYRKNFTCVHEAQVLTPPTPEAEALFLQATALDEYSLDPRTIDYAKVASLYRQSMELGYWKAQFNLAGLYLGGKGVPYDANQALRLTEDLMTKGVPAAWFNLGNFYMSGVGPLQADATVAYAFYQRAADMGSPHAQSMLGKALDADIEVLHRWANRTIGLRMLECAFTQGSGEAAYQLGISYENESETISDREVREKLANKALQRYHRGVKFGSKECAGSLSAAFGLGRPMIGGAKDPAREDRYLAISEYLRHHPDTKLPNLDKVLPLPPAKLPPWDGNEETLINAAKAVVPNPKPQKTSALTPAPNAQRVAAYTSVLTTGDRWGLARAPRSGLWLAQPKFGFGPDVRLSPHQNMVLSVLQHARPQPFTAGQTMAIPQATFLDGPAFWEHVQWVFMGERLTTDTNAVALTNWRVQSGQAVAPTETIANPAQCAVGHACPETGTWAASVATEHPAAASFNRWDQQSYVRQGEAMPTPIGVSDATGIDAADVTYVLLQRDPQPHFIGDATDRIAAKQEENRQRALEEYAKKNPPADEGDASQA